MTTLYTGKVESNSDGLGQGRVKVRVFGVHEQSKAVLKTEDLPWAQCIYPVTNSQTFQQGAAMVGLLVDSWVVGFFRDENDMQDFVVIGTYNGGANGAGLAAGLMAYGAGIYNAGAMVPGATGEMTAPLGDTGDDKVAEINPGGVYTLSSEAILREGGAKVGDGSSSAFIVEALKGVGIPAEALPSVQGGSRGMIAWARDSKHVKLMKNAGAQAEVNDILVTHHPGLHGNAMGIVVEVTPGKFTIIGQEDGESGAVILQQGQVQAIIRLVV